MATRVTLVTRPDATLAVSKTPLSGDRRDRIAEARWLEHAGQAVAAAVAANSGQTQQAGVVTVLTADATALENSTALDTAAPHTIVTERVPGETLRTTWLAPPGVAGALARVAEVLAELHEVDLVHGNLTLDHVILGPDGPRLCSPNGQTTDHEADARALGRCIETLLQRWDRLEVAVPERAEWERLAQALLADTEPLPLRRLVVSLDRLATVPSGESEPSMLGSTDSTGFGVRRFFGAREESSAQRRPSGLVAVAVLVLASLGGLAIGFARPDEAAAGPEVIIDGHRYQIDTAHAAATVVPDPCPGQPSVVSFDPATDTVWSFETPQQTPNTGQSAGSGVVLAVVPGAEQLEVTSEGACPSVWAVGPIGRTLVIDG